jgi:septum site-determining protein MinD
MEGNYVLTVAGSKGGVGKTTTSINLGACFVAAGYETVVVEVDLAMANLVDFVDIEMDPGEDETLDDVLADNTPVVDAVYDVGDSLSVVPSSPDLDRYGAVDIDRLEQALEHLWWHYDIVVLDTPAGAGEAVARPVAFADETLLVSTPRVSSVRNTRNTKAIVERAGTDVCGLVLTKSGTGASPGAERVAEFLDLDLLGHVPEDDAIPFSQDRGEPVVDHAPHSGAAIAYRKIASQLVESVETRADRTPASEGHTGTSGGVPVQRPGDTVGTGAESIYDSDTDRSGSADTPESKAHPEKSGSNRRDDDAETSDDVSLFARIRSGLGM